MEYQKSGAQRVDNNPTVGAWWYSSIVGPKGVPVVVFADETRMTRSFRLTGRNDAEFTAAWGLAHFTWCSSGVGKKSLAWKFVLDDEITVYVFSGTRGSSYEYVTTSKDKQAVGAKLVAFMNEKVLPVTPWRNWIGTTRS
jgi:hypothetical protein